MDHKSKMAVLEDLRRDAGNEAQGSAYIANNKKDWDPGYLENMRQTAKNASEQWELFSRLIVLEGEFEALSASRVENKSGSGIEPGAKAVDEKQTIPAAKAAVDEVVVKAGEERRILLTMTQKDYAAESPCGICGNMIGPGSGLDYFLNNEPDGPSSLVCDACAQKYAPDIIAIRQVAFRFAEREASLTRNDIREKIRDAINEPVEKRVMKVLDEICQTVDDDIPF